MSRRLTRRIKKALYDQELGYVKVAVSAYVCLLDKSTEEGSTYTFNYFSKELIHQPDTVVRGLGGRVAGMRFQPSACLRKQPQDNGLHTCSGSLCGPVATHPADQDSAQLPKAGGAGAGCWAAGRLHPRAGGSAC